jgi:hypothetical protein
MGSNFLQIKFSSVYVQFLAQFLFDSLIADKLVFIPPKMLNYSVDVRGWILGENGD